MNYETFNYLLQDLIGELNNYVNSENKVDEVYYTALRLLDEISAMSASDSDYRNEVAKWIKDGGTILLYELLVPVSYYDHDYTVHFEAFSLLDNVHCSTKKTNQYA